MTPKLFLATPTRDHQNAAAYTLSIVHLALRTQCSIDISPPMRFWDEDLVRTRSRYVREFLESDATHLLFVDADVSFAPHVVEGMLAAEHDFVAAPYPKKRIDWRGAHGARDDVHPEARAYEYPIVMLPGCTEPDLRTMTLEIAGIGLGCALISRACLTRMVNCHRAELEFDDVIDGRVYPTVALFQLLMTERRLLSEDLSFCRRWRDIGGSVHMFLGPGAPVDHVGPHYYRGHLAAFTR